MARDDEAFPVSLGEGATPLVRARRLGSAIGVDRLFLKFEGTNPTGSFKDRGMVLAVNRAVASGARMVVCASTGNTSASAAAYAAAAGMTCGVVLPAGKVARGKLAQALAAGARLVMTDGNFDAALEAVRELGASGEAVVVNSINPDRLDGQQTVAWEICDALDGSPDAVALPVGNAGNITAAWRGFTAYAGAGRTEGRPRMLGFQAVGAAPIVDGAPWPTPRPWRPRSGSETPPRGLGPRPLVTNLAGSSRPSQTARSSTHRPTSRVWKGSSASLRRPLAWPASASWRPVAGSSAQPRWSAFSPATA